MAERIFQNYEVAEKRAAYRDSLHQKRSNECIFCNVSKDLNNLPRLVQKVPVVASFEKSFLIVNRYPYVKRGHLLIMTKRHVTDISEMDYDEIKEIFKEAIPKVQGFLQKEYPEVSGFNIGVNIGKSAGASIGHLHIHIVPRSYAQEGFLETTASTRILDEHYETTLKRMAKYF